MRPEGERREVAIVGQERVKRLWIGAILALIAVSGVLRIQTVPLQNDEIYTLHVAKQEFGKIWGSLRAGADNHPPLDYWLRHVSMRLLGENLIGFRLPSLLGVMAGSVAFFYFVARKGGPLFAGSGVLLMLLLCGQVVAISKRGYGTLLCCFLVALYLWDRLESEPRSIRWGLAFGVTLTAAMYTHYYAILFFVPFGLAAGVPALLRRGSWRPVFWIVGAGLACLPLLPLMQTASRFRTGFWTPLTLTAGMNIYSSLLEPASPALALMAILLALSLAWRTGEEQPPQMILRPAMLVTIVLFALCPILLYILAKLVTHAFLPSYIYAGGVATGLLLLAMAAQIPLSGRRRFWILVAIPTVFIAIATARQLRLSMVAMSEETKSMRALMRLQQRYSVPLVVGAGTTFVQMSQYFGSEFVNAHYLFDTDPSSRSHMDLAIKGLRQVMPLRAHPYDEFAARERAFVFWGQVGEGVIERAERDGWTTHFHRTGPEGLSYWTITKR